MAAKQTAQYGVAAIAVAIVIIAAAFASMSLATTTSQSLPTSSQSSSTQATAQTSLPPFTTIQLGRSSSETSTQSSTTQGQAGSGILSIYLTDAPPSSPTLKYLLVNVSSLEVEYQGNIATSANYSASTSSTGTQAQSVYILTVPSNVGTNVNLSSLQGHSLPLGGASLPAGSIASIVLNITGAKAFYTDGSTEQLQVAADGKLMVPIQFGLQANGSTDLTIDITPNLAKISQALVLTPVIHVIAVEMGQNGTTTQTVTITESSPPSTTTVTTTLTITAPPTTVTTTVTTPTTTLTVTAPPTTVTTTVTTPTTTTQTVTSTTTLPPTTTTSTSTQTSTSTTSTTSTVTTTVTTTSSVPSPTSTSVSCDPNPVQVNHEAECKATVTSPLGGLSGRVSFSSDGKGTFGDVGCSDNGDNGNSGSLVCNVKYTPSANGTQTMTAAYPGDAHHSASSGAFQLSVNGRAGGNTGGPGTALASASLIAFPGLLAATFSTLPGRRSRLA